VTSWALNQRLLIRVCAAPDLLNYVKGFVDSEPGVHFQLAERLFHEVATR